MSAGMCSHKVTAEPAPVALTRLKTDHAIAQLVTAPPSGPRSVDGLGTRSGPRSMVNATLRSGTFFCNHHITDGETCLLPDHMKTASRAPLHLGYLLDELRSAGVSTYAGLAATLNRQGIRPRRGRWTAHELRLLMRRHRRAHPAAAENVGSTLYARRAGEARKVIRRLKRRGVRTQAMIARALNARGLTTPGLGRPWTARSVSRVMAPARWRRMRKGTRRLH